MTLAVARLAGTPTWTGWLHQAPRTATVVLLVACLAWYAVLAATEIRRPRLEYDFRRWASVLPTGMTALAALSAATVFHSAWLHDLGRVLL